jgi:hypothetical protein
MTWPLVTVGKWQPLWKNVGSWDLMGLGMWFFWALEKVFFVIVIWDDTV